jgi:acyl-CoA dehydrogenase
VEKKLKDAVRAGKLEKKPTATLAERGLAAKVITPADQAALAAAERARDAAVAVDSFRKAEYAQQMSA